MASAVPELPVLARDQAFEILYRRYVKDVYHYALALLRNPADAEDVTQTTFLNAYRAYKRGDEILKPQNWLIKIAHNVARTRYARAGRRVKEVPLEDHVEQLAVPEEDKPNIEGVLRALGRLPFNQRAALLMRELEGRSYAEIADTLNVSVSAVETLIFRGRKSLRLRASSLRVLTGVPLPGSLSQLFEGGAVVAGGGTVVGGGGAIVGTGFVAKAAVFLIVGAVATGVARNNMGPASAASETSRLAATPAWVSGKSLKVRGPGAESTKRAHAGRLGVHPLPGTPGDGQRTVDLAAESARATGSALAISFPGALSAPASVTTPVTTFATTTAAGTTTTATTAAAGLVSTVQQTAATGAAALPVQLPSVPALPVQVPSVPALPVKPPSVPALPVQPPPLPKPPSLP